MPLKNALDPFSKRYHRAPPEQMLGLTAIEFEAGRRRYAQATPVVDISRPERRVGHIKDHVDQFVNTCLYSSCDSHALTTGIALHCQDIGAGYIACMDIVVHLATITFD